MEITTVDREPVKRRHPLVAACALVLLGSAFAARSEDALEAGFRAPPAAAKPRVWWHWMDGNVSEKGIVEDLDWLSSVGIGGVHNFDAALGGGTRPPTPLVEQRLTYLSPGWRHAFKLAVEQAAQRHMEFTIAASPGWSESGGPWVKPAEGMKKLVWSETVVEGGHRVSGPLASPPRTTGPFMDQPFAAVPFAQSGATAQYFADAAVVAFRLPRGVAPLAAASQVTSSAGSIEGTRLADGRLATAIDLPYGEGASAWIERSYARPQRIQAVTVAVGRPAGGAPSDMATGASVWLEASDDGVAYRRVADIPRNGAPQQTLSFPPVTARHFRLVLARPTPQPSLLELLGIPAPPPPTAHRVEEFVLHALPRVNRYEDKAGFSNRAIAVSEDTPPVPAGEAIAARDVIELSQYLAADGTLHWTPPPGRWVVLRFGFSLTGRDNHPASREGTGLEVDKLNAVHVRAYFERYLAEYQQTLGTGLIGKAGLQDMLTDSYEAGIANWTDDLPAQFRARRGYDPTPWLPALAGYVVGSAGESDRFLWDFRATLGDLIADAHYGELSRLLHAHGMGRYGESHESGRAFIGDGMQVKKSADVPMGALWSSTLGQPRETFDADIRESASVAHIYGQNLVAAESLTAFGNTFAFTPATLKPFADRELAMGLNRFVIHTSVHQPDDRPGPGATLGPFGQWFTRHETWAGMAGPWVEYLTRSAYLLQQGRFVADVAYLYGEGDNITDLFGRSAPPIPAGYNFDYVNADALVHEFSAQDGHLETRSGMQYRVLALDASTRRMSLPVLRKLAELVARGVTVVGGRPEGSPSRADDAREFARLADSLWGRQRVRAEPLAAALARLGIPADCLLASDAGSDGLRWVHRQVAGGDLYFIASDSAASRQVQARFRVTGKAPELWHADTGVIEPASYRVEGGETRVPLALDPNGSVFVVFREAAQAAMRDVAAPSWAVLGRLSGPWPLSFPPGLGAPQGIVLPELASWTEQQDPGVRYFSGTATYARTIEVPAGWLVPGKRLRIDLGTVRDVARVRVNGRDLGVAWKSPYVVDLGDALHEGANKLEIEVANVWPNRMIGDLQPGAQRVAYATFDPFKADSKLLPAGLLGPVTVQATDAP